MTQLNNYFLTYFMKNAILHVLFEILTAVDWGHLSGSQHSSCSTYQLLWTLLASLDVYSGGSGHICAAGLNNVHSHHNDRTVLDPQRKVKIKQNHTNPVANYPVISGIQSKLLSGISLILIHPMCNPTVQYPTSQSFRSYFTGWS